MSLPAPEVSSRVIRRLSRCLSVIYIYVFHTCLLCSLAPDRDRKEHLLGAMKIAIVLASVVGVYALTMALTQPLSSLGKKYH